MRGIIKSEDAEETYAKIMSSQKVQKLLRAHTYQILIQAEHTIGSISY